MHLVFFSFSPGASQLFAQLQREPNLKYQTRNKNINLQLQLTVIAKSFNIFRKISRISIIFVHLINSNFQSILKSTILYFYFLIEWHLITNLMY